MEGAYGLGAGEEEEVVVFPPSATEALPTAIPVNPAFLPVDAWHGVAPKRFAL